MAHIGIFCLPMPSHLNLFIAVAETLASRGHRITIFGISESKNKIRDAGFEFQATDPDTVPAGTLGEMIRKIGTVGPWAAMRLQGRIDELRYEAVLQKSPAAVTQSKLDAMIVDQAEACTGSVAEVMGLP